MKVGALVAGDLALGLLMLTPNTNFMIGFAFHVLQQHHHLGLEKFFPELDRVVGSYLTQGERQIANSFHPTITFMAEISETEITFLDTNVYSGGETGGAGDREKRGREVYGRREKRGREAGFPRWREAGEKGKNYGTLRSISQSKKCKGAGTKKYRAGTGIKGYGKREV